MLLPEADVPSIWYGIRYNADLTGVRYIPDTAKPDIGIAPPVM